MDYPYANGTIKALESKINERSKLYALTKYEKSEFVKVLLSMNYGGTGSTIEELIKNELKKVKETIDSITPRKEDTDLFYLVNDASNIKVLYKIKKYQIDQKMYLNELGGIKSDALKEGILDDNFTNCNSSLKKLIEKINKLIINVQKPKILSAIIDSEIYKYAYTKTNNKILKVYLQTKIDFTNILSMIRAKSLNWKNKEFLEMFIPCGKIKQEEFVEVYDLDINQMVRLVCKYYKDMEKVFSKTKNLNEIQIEFERLSLSIMSEFKDEPFNIGPMIYYYLLKLAEAQNIRMLYSMDNLVLKDLI